MQEYWRPFPFYHLFDYRILPKAFLWFSFFITILFCLLLFAHDTHSVNPAFIQMEEGLAASYSPVSYTHLESEVFRRIHIVDLQADKFRFVGKIANPVEIIAWDKMSTSLRAYTPTGAY